MARQRGASNPGPWLPIGPFREWLNVQRVTRESWSTLCKDFGITYSQLMRWRKLNEWVPLDQVDRVMIKAGGMWTDIYDWDDAVSSATARMRKEDQVETGDPIERHMLAEYGHLSRYTASREFDDRRSEGITKDFAFNKLSFDGGEIRNPADNGHLDVGVDDIRVELVQGIDEDAFRRTLSMATKATLGVDLNAEQDEGDWEEMLQGGLQTALETQVIVFAVAGVSRACTHQLVRSRRAAFHQQSMRAHYYGDHPEMRIPESVWACEDDGARLMAIDAVIAAHHAYTALCQAGVSYQDARYVLPEGTTNFILLEYPVREFLNVYAYRACSMFQWEIVHVMREAKRVLVDRHPWIEPYVKISCEKTHGAKDGWPGGEDAPEGNHTCTFQGWEQVEGQCDFPWARETNRTFRSERHEIKRTTEGAA